MTPKLRNATVNIELSQSRTELEKVWKGKCHGGGVWKTAYNGNTFSVNFITFCDL